MIVSYWQNSAARLLFTWTRWLFLHHPSLRLVNFTLPMCGFVACIVAGVLLPGYNFTKEYGLIQQANGLLQILAPFFVAALALVAGFPGEALDRPMGGVRPYLVVAGDKHVPSRRELLGFLFAYLAGLSILTYLGGGMVIAASNPTAQHVLIWLGTLMHGSVGLCLKAAYGAILINLFGTTLLGLHFLGNFLTSSRIERSSGSDPLGPAPPPSSPSSAPELHRMPAERRMRRQG
jgi:hypothetical protein